MEQSLQVISRQERQEKWTSRIMACRSSGMTVRACCRENQVPEKSHYYWQRQLFEAASRQHHFVQPALPKSLRCKQSRKLSRQEQETNKKGIKLS